MRKTTEDRFWEKVDKRGPGECWEWSAQRTDFGYGRFRDGRSMKMAHRFSWELCNGSIPDGMLVLHDCDNPSCVNPAHLRLGTYQDNCDDMMEKGRGPIGERHGRSKLTKRQVMEIRAAHPPMSMMALSRKYKISRSVIGDIIRREIWTHI